eukprot:TRINITY_DN1840_c0_g1_i1.p1 TRINITY_DN1840_c0_g1~~TRINITY_DN1840_c0_g1_i1.p1  ORF type:complete len:479 (+),score=84.70 TRINITY_DN1840_c0_g1_i1:82-1518(+)
MSDDDYYDDDDDFEEELDLHESTQGGLRKSYEALRSSGLQTKYENDILEIMDLLDLKESKAISLLRKFNWDKEKLSASYLENSKSLLDDLKVTTLRKRPKGLKKGEKVTCPVCYEEIGRKDTTVLRKCHHFFCNDCWRGYLANSVSEGISCVVTKCPAPNCGYLVPKEVFDLLEPDKLRQYKKFMLDSYVSENPKVKWCPFPGCECSVFCDRPNRVEPVTCSCGFSFCFRCNDYEIGNHAPVPCKMILEWRDKESSESENINWLTANTKRCPKCRAPIEKNGGCMHMTCRKNAGGCGHEFCWLCRADWRNHGTCNKSEDILKEEAEAAAKKTELDRYIHYYHRYQSHANAMKVADTQVKNATIKGETIRQALGLPKEDMTFLHNAAVQLVENRRILKNSYAYGYYLDASAVAAKNLFDYLQQDLESHTNHLSELYEEGKISDYHSFMAWREDVINFTRVSKHFLQNFIEGVVNGLTPS